MFERIDWYLPKEFFILKTKAFEASSALPVEVVEAAMFVASQERK